MIAMYGHPWVSLHGVSPQDPQTGRMTVSGDTWAKALSGVNPRQLADGLAKCLAEAGEFPPSAPRFRAMCLGIPSFEAINAELLTAGSKRSPFAALVWSHVDAYQHRHARAEEAKRMRREAYATACERVMRGEPLPMPAAQVEHQQDPLIPQGIPTTREGRVEHLRHVLGQAFSERAATRDLHEAEKATQQRHVSPVEEFEL